MLRKFVLLMAVLSAVGLSACSKSSNTSGDAGNGGDNNKPDPNSIFGGVCDNSGADASSELSGIVNGHKLGQNNMVSNRIVSLYFVQGTGHAICTGSLLPNKVILTAAHCIASTRKPEDMYVMFTNNLSCLTHTNKKQFVRLVNAIAINVDYRETAADTDNDIAMVHFAGDVPAGFETFDVPSQEVVINPTDKLIMAGYGVTKYGASDSMVLRITSLPGARKYPKDAKSYTVDQHDTGVCSGDSGGPMMVYKYGRLQIVGVASSVSNNPVLGESMYCSGRSAYADVSKQLDWISTNYNSLMYYP